MSKLKLATVWLDGCSGCHMSLLDIDEALIEVAKKADIVFGPLVDAQQFPEAVDVTLVEGAVSSVDDLHMLETIRRRTKVLVALGDCAVTGNVPAMRNTIPVKQLMDRIYGEKQAPRQGVPALLKRATPLQEAVRVDLHVPGCPPAPESIAFAVMELLEGRKPDLSGQVKFG